MLDFGNEISAVVNVTILTLAALLFFAYRRVRAAMNEIERHGISSAAGEVPSVVLENDTAVEIMLAGGKRIIVSVLDMNTAREWRRWFMDFLTKQYQAMNMLPFLSADEIKDEAQREQAIKQFAATLSEYKMQRAVAKLLGRTVLKRRLVERVTPGGVRKMCRTRPNPDGITARWLMRNATEFQLAEIILCVYAYNNGAYVKKNYLSLLATVAALHPGTKGMPSYRQSSPGTRSTGGDQPLYPESPFTPGLKQKEENKSAEPLTRSGQSEKISGGDHRG